MSVRFHWHGHSAWTIEAGGKKILVDPFLTGNPTADIGPDQVEADVILLTHAHGDHLGDTVAIAKRTGAPVVTNNEIAIWLGKQGIGNAVGLNPGGHFNLPVCRVMYTFAIHSSSFPDGSYGGVAGGFMMYFDGLTVYNSGDTALFSDMALFGERYKPDLAMLCIGDYFTMGPDDSIAALKMLKAEYVLPQHYNTFPPIQQDANAWAEKVRHLGVQPTVLQPGGEYTSK
ncbi:MAG: metal-dependent hydrolase [Anaerolineae bacterium]